MIQNNERETQELRKPMPASHRCSNGKNGGSPPAPPATASARICFVAPAAWPFLSGANDIEVIGGAEVQQGILARALAAAGHSVSMITLDYGQQDGVEVGGIRCYKTHTPEEGLPVLRYITPRLTSFWRALHRAGADVYYTRSASHITAFVAEYCRQNGRKSIYAGASDADFIPGQEPIRFGRDRWLFRRGLARTNAVIVQNGHQYATCKTNHGLTPLLIPSCYAPQANTSADRAGHVLWVGSIVERKRPELCLRLAREMPHLKFVMIGGASPDADSRSFYRKIATAARSLPNLEFLGFLPYRQTERYFDRSRVFLNTSRIEGFPNTFLQAWARGLPTVSFVDTGSREGGHPVCNTVQTTAEARAEIHHLMTDDVRWKHASDICRSHFSAHHSLEAVTGMYMRVIAGLAGTMRQRAGSG